jgi:hypothetical protein
MGGHKYVRKSRWGLLTLAAVAFAFASRTSACGTLSGATAGAIYDNTHIAR